MATQPFQEVKDAIKLSLQRDGVLAKFRSELRVAVFEAVNKDENQPDTSLLSSFKNPRRDDFLKRDHGVEVLSLVQDLLNSLGLVCTSKVFQQESLLPAPLSREHLAAQLNISSEQPSQPLLVSLVSQAHADHSPSSHPPLRAPLHAKHMNNSSHVSSGAKQCPSAKPVSPAESDSPPHTRIAAFPGIESSATHTATESDAAASRQAPADNPGHSDPPEQALDSADSSFRVSDSFDDSNIFSVAQVRETQQAHTEDSSAQSHAEHAPLGTTAAVISKAVPHSLPPLSRPVLPRLTPPAVPWSPPKPALSGAPHSTATAPPHSEGDDSAAQELENLLAGSPDVHAAPPSDADSAESVPLELLLPDISSASDAGEAQSGNAEDLAAGPEGRDAEAPATDMSYRDDLFWNGSIEGGGAVGPGAPQALHRDHTVSQRVSTHSTYGLEEQMADGHEMSVSDASVADSADLPAMFDELEPVLPR